MLKKIIPIIVAGLLLSCSGEEKAPGELESETPEAIEVVSSYDILSSKSRGWTDNIIERLYQEAIEKNKEVEALNQFIQKANNTYVDSLIDYKKYLNINEEYWETANDYISQITDTTLRKSMKELFDQSELTYCDSKNNLINIKDKIDIEKEHFDNQVVFLKLAVTLPMIENYQRNEKPDSTTLKEVIIDFDNANTVINNFVIK